MADAEHLRILQQGRSHWNTWRRSHQELQLYLSGADLSGADLSGADLHGADLSGADLTGVDLTGANLHGANLHKARLHGTDLSGANLIDANLSEAYLFRANLKSAGLNYANLSDTHLKGTDLSRTDLSYACLKGANLSGANFSGANLHGADLHRANLSQAHLSYANVSYTDLHDADLSYVYLHGANLSGANLSGANLSNAVMGWTSLGELDLRVVKGLETIWHQGPSYLSMNTLYKSEGTIPEVFVQGTGAPDSFIEYMHTLAAKPIQYSTCFIRYSTKNQDFAERLYADLQGNGVRCWYACEDLREVRPRQDMDEAVRQHDKIVLILSVHSVGSKLVEHEVLAAMKKEKQEKQTILFPIRIDNSINTCSLAWASEIRKEHTIGNFTGWKWRHLAYQKAFQRLLLALKEDTK